MKNLAFLIVYLFVTLNSLKSQGIAVDNKQNSVFSFYSFEDVRFNIDADEPLSLTFSAFRFLKSVVQNPVSQANLVTNNSLHSINAPFGEIPRISGLVVTMGLTNSEKQFLKFNSLKDFQPGGKFKIGWQSSIYNYTNNPLPANRNGGYLYGLNLTAQVDNLKLYSSGNDKITYEYPFSFGLDGNFSRLVSSSYYFQMFLSVNAAYLNTWNDDELINYQLQENVTFTNTSIVALEDFDGRYGSLKRGRHTGRVSFSAPMYFWLLNITPYVSTYAYDYTNPDLNVGVFTNVLSEWFNVDDSAIPSSVGLGWDFTIKDGKISAPNYFIKGTLNFGQID